MRTISIAFLLCLLLQSCHSYKNLNNTKEPLVVGKKYKLKLDRDADKYVKVKITGLTETGIVGLSDGREIQIAYKDVWEVRKRKFSVGKSLLMAVATVITVGTIHLIIEGPSLGGIDFGY
nr:hypothetical protein [uncultured Allomuricauda sp.]